MKENLGVIGAGNMAGAILRGALRAGVILPAQVWLSNPTAEKLTPYAELGIHTTTDNRAVARMAELLLLAVKPQVLPNVLTELAPLTAGKCVVSIAAGISQSWLRRQLPGAYIVCAMPNTPLLVGKGATAISNRGDVPPTLYQSALSLFSAAGAVEEVSAEQINAVTPVNGSSPAFFFRMIGVMADLAAERGIDHDAALRLAAATMEGAAAMLLSGEKSPEELTRQVCSPDGTTLAALSAFDDLDFDGLLREAFDRCVRRGEELGR